MEEHLWRRCSRPSLGSRGIQPSTCPGRKTEPDSVRRLSKAFLLGGISSGSFYALKNRAAKTLDEDQLTRISLLVGIYKALNILYGQNLADAWIALPNTNPMFAGDSPLHYVRKGGIPAFLRVRQVLDARRGGK
jgi:hypothetical protein